MDLKREDQVVTTAEVITDSFEEISSRQQAAFVLLKAVFQWPEEERSQVVSRIFNSASQRGLALNLDTRVFTLGVDPKYVENRHKALEYIEKNLLSREDFTP